MTPPTRGEPEDTEQLGELPRPQVMRDPGQRAHKAELAAALFGQAPEVVRVGRFRVGERLGEGGMGVVHAGHDDELGRRVAIKLLHVALGEDRDARVRLLREAQALARLSHPNVVQIFEVGEHRGQLYVAMEHVPGQTLHAWLRVGGARPWRAALEVLLAAGRGLAAAHAVGLVHRDFKPSNVMLGEDGRARVLDFGLARALGEEVVATTLPEGEALELVRPLTLTGGVLGTPAYMAPEQFRGQRCDARSDQFSFCVALFEALHGARPFAGTTAGELYAAIERGAPARPPAGSQVPVWLHAAVVRGLARGPEDRWPSMAALLHELASDREGLRRRRRFTAAFGAVGAVALALGGGLGVQQAQERARQAACAAEGAEIRELWNPVVRASLLGRLGRDVDQAERAEIANTLDNLESSADEWRRSRVEACLAPTPDTGTREYTQARVLRCFDESRDDLRTAIAALVQAAPGEAPNAWRLAEVKGTSCLDAEWLARAGGGYPDDPALRKRWQAVRARIIAGDQAIELGRHWQAEGLLREAVTAARAMATPALEIEALRVLIKAQFAAGRRTQALASLEAVLPLAAEVDRGDLSTDMDAIPIELVLGAAGGPARENLAEQFDGPRLRKPLVARHSLADALGDMSKLWRADFLPRWWFMGELFLRRIAATAEAWTGLGDAAKGEEYARNGLVAFTGSHHVDPHLEIDLQTTLGRANLGLGRVRLAEAALRRASELIAMHDEPSSARRGWVWLARTELELARGELDAAGGWLARAEAERNQAAGEDDRFAPQLMLAQASLHARRGAADQAEALLTLARRALAGSHGVTRTLWVTGEVQRARLEVAGGELEAAEDRLADALRVNAAQIGAEHAAQAPILALQGQLLRARGDLEGSRGTLERALEMLESSGGPPHVRGELEDQLARTLAALGEGPARVRSLALAARERYVRGEIDRGVEVAALDAWLAALPN